MERWPGIMYNSRRSIKTNSEDAGRVSPCKVGFGMYYGSRQGIARFGMGMKTAALSMSSILEVYSWQEPEAIYTMTLDVEAIGRERANLVELPEPTLLT